MMKRLGRRARKRAGRPNPLMIAPLVALCLGLASCSGDEGSPSGPVPTVYDFPATYEDGILIIVAAGKNVRITTTGEVNTNPDGPAIDCNLWTDADGIPDCGYVISEPSCHGLPFMALIGIFNDDEYFLVGTDFDSTFAEAGELRLEINDLFFTDNEGAFTVSVVIR
jgi:hypothetical protein